MPKSDVLRTPDERFADLPAMPWTPRYTEALPGYEGLRMAYLDEGGSSPPVWGPGPTFLCLHGEPTWSFLYRKMLPVFLETGARVVAPDYFGFGRSDKPRDDAVYSWSFHRQSLVAFIEALDLRNITLVCQDWGGVLGLTLPMQMPERFARLLVMNTALGVGIDPGPGFLAWKQYVHDNPDIDVGALMARAVPGLSRAERAAYDAPFPSAAYKAGVRAFPAIVPITPDMEGASISREAALWWGAKWDGPTFMAVGVQDPVLGLPVMNMLRGIIRGCPEPLLLEDAGHFAQESGDVIARAALAAWAGKPLRVS